MFDGLGEGVVYGLVGGALLCACLELAGWIGRRRMQARFDAWEKKRGWFVISFHYSLDQLRACIADGGQSDQLQYWLLRCVRDGATDAQIFGAMDAGHALRRQNLIEMAGTHGLRV